MASCKSAGARQPVSAAMRKGSGIRRIPMPSMVSGEGSGMWAQLSMARSGWRAMSLVAVLMPRRAMCSFIAMELPYLQ